MIKVVNFFIYKNFARIDLNMEKSEMLLYDRMRNEYKHNKIIIIAEKLKKFFRFCGDME